MFGVVLVVVLVLVSELQKVVGVGVGVGIIVVRCEGVWLLWLGVWGERGRMAGREVRRMWLRVYRAKRGGEGRCGRRREGRCEGGRRGRRK